MRKQSTALRRSADRKTTNRVAVSKTTGEARADIANAFGLPPGRKYSCPSAGICETFCYGGGDNIDTLYPNVKALLLRNWELLKDEDLAGMVALLDDMMVAFESDCDHYGADKNFRIHWDGDFFSPVYTAAWAKVIAAHPTVQFWVYTRVATSAKFLHSRKLPNLALYFSGDHENLVVAKMLQKHGIKIAFVADTFEAGAAALAGATRCPENNGALPLIAPEGSACARCGLCVHGRKDVLFSITKK